MERLSITTNDQKKFFSQIKIVSGLNWQTLGKVCGVTDRTLRDWARAKYTLPYKAANLLSHKFNVALPKHNLLKQYWYIDESSKMGALARYKLYGPPGNRETRRLGGLESQKRRRENPEKYRLLGCNTRKVCPPLKYSDELAELCGILLGDGGLTDYQVRVTLNRKVDYEYSEIVKKLITFLFKESPSRTLRKNVVNLTLSSAGYVEALEKIGLVRGNKIKNQVVIPNWILENSTFAKKCLRGLIDTDGCVYYHKHIVKNKEQFNMGLTFTNHSKPLIQDVANVLRQNNFTPSILKEKRVYIYNLEEIKRYFKVIGSSNPKHIKKFENFLAIKENTRKGAGVV